MKARLLVVDDDANIRESLKDNLELEGYEVLVVATGADALEAASERFYDVILMDFNLTNAGGMTGIDVIRQIRRTNTDSKILMITAHGSEETASRAIDEAVYAYLTKPVDFNQLKKSIAKALDSLRLEQDRKQLVEELQRAKDRLQNLSNMKSKFMSMASHDLSNSLMTLQVSFELLAASIKPNTDQQKRIDYISGGITQLSRLIEDLVDWAAIEQGKFRFEKKPLLIDKMLAQVIVGPQSKAAQQSIAMELEVERGLPVILADQRRITQVVNNLLENAIRHSHAGGKITVTASRPSDVQVQVSIRDTGDGIPPAEIARIFERFYQPNAEKQRAAGGRLGLGLSIAREIVTGHGGKLWVESPGESKGSTFIFTLPVEADPEKIAETLTQTGRKGVHK